MGPTSNLPTELVKQIRNILADLRRRTGTECILLADVSGQLLGARGKVLGIDPVLVAVLAAADIAAIAQVSDQITRPVGDRSMGRSFLHEGGKQSVYLFNVAARFILIIIFRTGVSLDLIQMLVRRASEQLHPLATEFEDLMGPLQPVSSATFGSTLAQELDRRFQ